MHDKYSNIDKTFTDKGWAAMRDLLDEEMPATVPEERKRRRWIFFLLFFGIGLGIAVGVVAGGLYFMENDIQEMQKAVIQQPIADGSSEINVEEKEDLRIAKEDAGLVENQKLAATAIVNNSQLKNQETSAKQTKKLKNERQNHKIKRLAEEKNLFESINKSNNKISDSSFSAIKESYGVSDTVVGTKEFTDVVEKMKNLNLASTKKVKKDGVDYLAVNDLNEFEIATMMPDFNLNLPASELPDEDTDDKTLKSKARFGIEVGGRIAPNFVGASAGLIYSVPLKNKWSLQTGLNYQYQQRTFTGTPIEADNFASEYLLDDDNGAFEGAYAQNAVRSESEIFTIPQNLNSQYLNMPLRANYQLSEKWSVGAGVTGALLLFASNSYTDGGLLNDNENTSFDDLAISAGGNGAADQKSINKANLRNFDVAGNIGIAFHPSPKWSITANYHHGFVNFFKYSSDKKYNRYANLSLQYHFGQ